MDNLGLSAKIKISHFTKSNFMTLWIESGLLLSMPLVLRGAEYDIGKVIKMHVITLEEFGFFFIIFRKKNFLKHFAVV